jgi:hypothetical protein
MNFIQNQKNSTLLMVKLIHRKNSGTNSQMSFIVTGNEPKLIKNVLLEDFYVQLYLILIIQRVFWMKICLQLK